MQRFTLLALTAAALLVAPSCKKDQVTPQSSVQSLPQPQPQPQPQPTTEQLVTDKLWLITGVTVNPGLSTNTGATVTNLYPYIPACTKDDTQQFVSGGVFKIDEGTSKCDANDPQTTTGTWTAAKSGSDTILKATVNGGTLHLKVLSISDTQLQVSTQDDVFGIGTGTSNTYTLTYSKQ